MGNDCCASSTAITSHTETAVQTASTSTTTTSVYNTNSKEEEDEKETDIINNHDPQLCYICKTKTLLNLIEHDDS